MEPTDPSWNKHSRTSTKTSTKTSDVGTTIAMMEEVLNADGSTSIVAGYNQWFM